LNDFFVMTYFELATVDEASIKYYRESIINKYMIQRSLCSQMLI
jgi:hypothetical protein